jgi:formylmethanofuran dehydrogenase subunit B
VVCPGCACLCDDVRIRLQGERLLEFSPQCKLGESWFEENLRVSETSAWVRGQSTDWEAAIGEAAELLAASQYPLIYGLSRSATPGQRIAVEIGDFLGAAVDTTASLCHGPSIMAIQEVGEVTCTLGEIRNRADLVVFWGCNPAESHPRHVERYSVNAVGKFTSQGRGDRQVIMVGNRDDLADWQLDAHGTEPDLRIPIEPERDLEALAHLVTALKDPTHESQMPSELKTLLNKMRSCRYGVVFFGVGLAETGPWGGTRRSGTGHVNVNTLLHLVAELNAHARFTARRMRLQGDVSGADNVLCWQTTYPFAVDLSRGYPRYNPGEFTANELLERGEVDMALLVGGETVPYLTEPAREHLNKIPTIVLDYSSAPRHFDATVQFATSVYGIHAKGVAYRMDNVPLELKQLVESPLPTDEDVLREILAYLSQHSTKSMVDAFP